MPLLIGFPLVARFAIACLITSLAAAPAVSDELDVLKGETIRVIIGSGPGGTTDTVSRAFFNAFSELIPEATIRLQNMSSGSGTRAIKELQDSSGKVITLATFGVSPIYAQLMSSEEISFDLSRLQWVGSLTNNRRILGIRKGLGGSNIDALYQLDRQPIFPTDLATGSSAVEARLLNAIAGMRIRVVAGVEQEQRYTMLLAGDVDLLLAGMAQVGHLLESGDLIPVLKFSKDGYPSSMDGLPEIRDVVQPGAPEDLVLLLQTLNKTGRMIAAAPNTDASVVSALRVAFAKVIVDPDFLDAMAKNDVEIDATSGEELADRLGRMFKRSGEFKDIITRYSECGQLISDGIATTCN